MNKMFKPRGRNKTPLVPADQARSINNIAGSTTLSGYKAYRHKRRQVGGGMGSGGERGRGWRWV